LTKALVSRYGFEVWPKSAEEFDEGKGIKFAMGRLGKAVIERKVVFSGFVLAR
jgi:hypothetical protein